MRKSVRFVATILLAMMVLGLGAGVALACGDTPPCPPPPCVCEYNSPGYWKNHPEAWPLDSIVIGGVTYSKAQAIALMSSSVSGDKTYTMFKAVVAAKLNIASGCSPIAAFWAGDDWLAANPVGSGVAGSSSAWACGDQIYLLLDAYNNQ